MAPSSTKPSPSPVPSRTVLMLNKGGDYRGRHNPLPGQVVGDELQLVAGEQFWCDEPTARRLDEQHGPFDRFERVTAGSPSTTAASSTGGGTAGGGGEKGGGTGDPAKQDQGGGSAGSTQQK